MDNMDCVLCKRKILGHGHNALPLKNGRCCIKCNDEKVIPQRLILIKKQEDIRTMWDRGCIKIPLYHKVKKDKSGNILNVILDEKNIREEFEFKLNLIR